MKPGSIKSPPPVLLTKTEALDHAARQLDDMASHIMLVATLSAALGNNVPDAFRNDIALIREALVDPTLQIAAAKDAAAAIRALALEERLVAARVAAGAGIKA